LLVKSGKNLREIPGKKKIVVPYVVVSFNGQQETLYAKLQNTMAPSWNCKVQFLYGTEGDDDNILTLKVCDKKGQKKDEFLGECSIDLSKLDHKKERFEFKDYKLTHPKEEVQGRLWFIVLVSTRTVAVDAPEEPRQDHGRVDKKHKKSARNDKGKTQKPTTEKHTIDTKAGIAAPPDLLWKFMSSFHDVEDWLPKMPCQVLPSQDGRLLRKIKYPGHEEELMEQLDQKDDTNMTFQWSSVAGKQGQRGLAGTIGYSMKLVIVPVGRTRSRLTWVIVYDLPVEVNNDEVKKFFVDLVEIGLTGLKVAAEG